jgi:tetratricopeptide (TPR) repeat protein
VVVEWRCRGGAVAVPWQGWGVAEDNVDIVKLYLRAQNLEQLGRIDDAIELYERALSEAFDSAGPYDRLIALYSHRALHDEVVRVAEAAIQNVHTYEDKLGWYEIMRAEAIKLRTTVPRAAPRTGE